MSEGPNAPRRRMRRANAKPDSGRTVAEQAAAALADIEAMLGKGSVAHQAALAQELRNLVESSGSLAAAYERIMKDRESFESLVGSSAARWVAGSALSQLAGTGALSQLAGTGVLSQLASHPSFLSVPAATPPEPKTPDKRTATLEESLFNEHAPDAWSDQPYAAEVRSGLKQGKPVDLVVLTADIRSSTLLMKEAVDPLEFASLLGFFVERARDMAWSKGGWFDKFTGDGFLAFWPHKRTQLASTLPEVLAVVRGLFVAFYEDTLPALRANSQNFPTQSGLAFGLAAGPATLAKVVGQLAVVGPAVVGAARMVSIATARETLANSYLGEAVVRAVREDKLNGVSVTRDTRQTKEYDTQAIYAVKFDDLELPE